MSGQPSIFYRKGQCGSPAFKNPLSTRLETSHISQFDGIVAPGGGAIEHDQQISASGAAGRSLNDEHGVYQRQLTGEQRTAFRIGLLGSGNTGSGPESGHDTVRLPQFVAALFFSEA